MTDRSHLNPWDIRPDETARAYEAFAVYRDMGPGRSQDAAAERLAKTRQLLSQWAMKYDWTARVRAFDEAAARRAAEASLEDHTAVRVRQAQQARIFSTRGAQRMAGLNPDVLTPAEAIQAFRVGSQVEREALGIASTVAVVNGDGKPFAVAVTEVVVEKPAEVADYDPSAGR